MERVLRVSLAGFVAVLAGCNLGVDLGHDRDGGDSGQHVVDSGGADAAFDAREDTALDSGVRDVGVDTIGLDSAADTGWQPDVAFDVAMDQQDAQAPDHASPDATDDSSHPDAGPDVVRDATPADAGPRIWDGTLPTTGVCSVDGWCWRNPLPMANPLSGVWGSSATDVWAVGRQGTIIHWNGVAWTGVTGIVGGVTFDDSTLIDVTGSGPTDAWILAPNNYLLHWNGTRWTPVDSGTTFPLSRIWARAANDAWAVGRSGTVLHWDGTAWSPASSGTVSDLGGVWGFAANDVWIVGANGTARHWDGAAWSDQSTGLTASASLGRMWGAATNNLWAVGNGIFHWTGSAWSGGAGTGTIAGVWGSGPNDVLFLGAGTSLGSHWDGTSSHPAAVGCGLGGSGVWGSAATGYYVTCPNFVMPGSVLYISDGHTMATDQLTWSLHSVSDIRSIWASAPDDIYMTGADPGLFHGNGTTWTTISPGASSPLTVTGRARDDVWVTASTGIVSHWNGTTWSPSNIGVAMTPIAVSAASTTDAWTAAGSTVFEWNGTSWANRGDLGASVTAVWASSSHDAWASAGSQMHHYDGSAWSSVAAPFPVNVMWGTGPTDVWGGTSGGIAGMVSHWDGSAWTTSGTLGGVVYSGWGSGNTYWATGGTLGRGDVYWWDGASAHDDWSGSDFATYGIGGSGPSDVWLAGIYGILLHHGM